MALVRKSNPKTTSSSQRKTIKVSPYENPENVMDLMAKICSEEPSEDEDIFFDTVFGACYKEINGISLADYLEENRGSLYNQDFFSDLKELFRKIDLSISEHENTEHTKIVVAGGFSSGKSSFLNKLTKSQNLLPTGVEPVSVVKTYLYCSRNNSSVSVKGVNLKSVLVKLDTGVLQAIQHARQSNIHLASVLEKLFVEIPSKDLDSLVFIDTPGYNNSDKANRSNGKTDKETALEALSEGNVLFWLVDCERGTTVSDDLEIIKKFQGKKVFIFNKADKKGRKESKNIVEAAAHILYNEFPKDEIIDILAYSTLDSEIYYSANNMTLSSIVAEAKKAGNGISEIKDFKAKIKQLFDNEITISHKTINGVKEKYSEYVEKKNQTEKNYRDVMEYRDSVYEDLKDVLIDDYNNVLEAADKIIDSSKYAIDSFLNFFNGVMNFENNDHWGSSTILTKAIDRASNAYDRACNKHNAAIDYQYYKEEYRNDLVERVYNGADLLVEKFEAYRDDARRACEDALANIENEEDIIKSMTKFKNVVMDALNLGIKKLQKQCEAQNLQSDKDETPDVFECINKEDYNKFLHSFEKEVDMSACNGEGYSPLTLAVQKGNNAMVKFMLDHGASPSAKDRRGYNAFHTAVENQFRDICEMLLDNDPDLISTKTAGGETVEELADKQAFKKWIEKEISKAI